MMGKGDTGVDNWRCILAIALLASFTPAAVVLGPLVVGAYVTDLGFSAQQAGYLIAAELIGAGLATFVAYALVSRMSWHTIMRLALLVCAGGNAASAFLADPTVLMPVRFVTGVAVGTVMTMTIVMVGMTRDQERNFGFWSMGQVVFAVLGFAVIPQVIPSVGIAGLFLGMGAIMLAMQLAVSVLPATGTAEHSMGLSSLTPTARKLAPIGLVALLFFYIGIGSVWAYVERIGDQAGFDAAFIGYVLSGSSVVGVLGAMLATWMSTRFGRLMPAALGYAIIGATIAMYYGIPTATIFTAASLAFKFGWWFLTPYALANMTQLDPSGRIAVLTNLVIGLGLGFGPAIAAMLLGPESATGGALDYTPIIGLGVVCVIISFVLLLPVIRFNSGEGAITAEGAEASA